MTQEQKAKAYDEAIKIAKEINNEHRAQPFDIMTKVFPELKESEDERVRKGLVKAVSGTFEGYKLFGTDVTREEALAWLEKQGEKKPSDKVEPKFHEGEWIISNNKKSTYQVIEVKRGVYVIRDNADNHEYHIGIEECEKSGRLFTIQDAKDGDVLVASDGSIFLFSSVVDCACKCYVALTTFNDIKINKEVEGGYWETSRAVCPATKEQRDALMKAITDAGYTFDFEKKELKKIEHKPAWSEEDEKYIKDLTGYFTEGMSLKHTEEDIMRWLKSLKPQKQWKPSDEQLKMLDKIIDALDRMQLFGGRNTLIDLKEQLKKLREE